MTTNIFITGLQELRRRAQEAMEAARLQYLQQQAVKKAAEQLLPPPATPINELLEQRLPDIRSLLKNPKPIGRREPASLFGQGSGGFEPAPIIFTTSTVAANLVTDVQASFTVSLAFFSGELTVAMARIPRGSIDTVDYAGLLSGGGDFEVSYVGLYDPEVPDSTELVTTDLVSVVSGWAVTPFVINTRTVTANKVQVTCAFRYFKDWDYFQNRRTWEKTNQSVPTPSTTLYYLKETIDYEVSPVIRIRETTAVETSMVTVEINRTFPGGVETYSLTEVATPFETAATVAGQLQVITPAELDSSVTGTYTLGMFDTYSDGYITGPGGFPSVNPVTTDTLTSVSFGNRPATPVLSEP